MSVGLIALLDDVAAMAKLAAASIDDVSAAAARASAKAAGVVIDDAAVTPRYVTGLSPERELPIIGRIAAGSLRNKLLFLLPAALALSAWAPWALTPLLMLGGAYLCFEGAEKIIEYFFPHKFKTHDISEAIQKGALKEHEESTVKGAIRTDFILSAEIMAISLSTISDESLWQQALILVVVSLFITATVYGVVAMIVKMDDIGLHLCREHTGFLAHLGSGLVRAMPKILAALTVVGTIAMLWVGGGIIVHGLEELGLHWPAERIEGISHILAANENTFSDMLHWLIHAIGAAIVGTIVGSVLAFVLSTLTPSTHKTH